jgi:hypothetical protein
LDHQLRAQVEYLEGQVVALQAAVRGLILASADPARAAAIVAHLLEEMQARGLASPSATDHLLRGLESSPPRLVPTDGQIEQALDLDGYP